MKDKYLSCRVSKSEYDKIKKLLKDNNIKLYDLIDITLNNYSRQEQKQVIYELQKIGNNINQITKSINQKNGIDYTKELKEIKELLYAIKNEL